MSIDFNAMNSPVVEEFRANHGVVGGYFAGMQVLLLTTTGAKSGAPRLNPLVYLTDGDRYVVFASRGGTTRNPDWYYNLLANPSVGVEIGDESFAGVASEITGEERDRLYDRQVAAIPQFGEYAKTAGRVIPVIAITRA